MVNIISVFKSIDGEVNAFYQGAVTVFVRLAECNCRCSYCDTKYSFAKGIAMEVHEVVRLVTSYRSKKVTITGGEPLLQLDAVLELIQKLLALGYKVSVETNGSIAIPELYRDNQNVSWVVDYKLISSNQMEKMIPEAFESLTQKDFVKFVISDKDDFDAALNVRSDLRNKHNCHANFAFAPLHGSLNPKDLYELIEVFGDGSELMNVQLHKYIWPNCGATEER